MATALLNLALDNSVGDNFSNWAGGISSQFAAFGLVKTADTGQLQLGNGAQITASSSDPNYPVANAADANTVNSWRSAALPTPGAPQWVMFDAGAGRDFTPRSLAIYQNLSPNDPRDIVLQSAGAPAGPWTDIETRTLPPTSGTVPVDLPSAPAARCYRLLINSVQGGSGFVQILDFQLWSASGLGGTRAQPSSSKPSSANVVQGYEIWRMGDARQSSSPAFLKIEYGAGVFQQFPGLWLSIASATDGAGNLTGVGVSERRQLRANGSSIAPVKSAFSGSTNRVAAALGYATQGFLWFAWERSHNSNGNDTDEGQFLVAGSGYDKFQLWVPLGSAAAPTDTDYGCIGPTGATGVKGSAVGLYGIRAFAPEEKSPAIGALGYFNSDLTADSPVSGVKLFGQTADRTILPLGGSITTIMRGNGNSRLALLWE